MARGATVTIKNSPPPLSDLHVAILKILALKPDFPSDAELVRKTLYSQGYPLYDICMSMCALEAAGQLTMGGLDATIDQPMTLTLTPSGKLTALGTRLGIRSVMLNPAQEGTIQ